MLRGEDASSGVRVQNGITVYLQGNCSLLPGPRRLVTGALGWVPLEHGRIEPFVYVECSRIGEMLGPQVLGMPRSRRNTVMGEAIARVVVHEWIHIATQNTGHGKRGITQAQFGVSDLLAEDEELGQSHREKKRQHGM